MFDGPRYCTRGVAAEVPSELQQILWLMVDQLRLQGKMLDYLQVFGLSPVMDGEGTGQRIVHSQEEPPYKREYVLQALWTPFSGRVWIIDDGDRSTMLLPNEY